jgi:hypothetical protein
MYKAGGGGVESTTLWSLLASNRSRLNLREAICDIYLLAGLTTDVRGALAVALRVSSAEVARSSFNSSGAEHPVAAKLSEGEKFTNRRLGR